MAPWRRDEVRGQQVEVSICPSEVSHQPNRALAGAQTLLSLDLAGIPMIRALPVRAFRGYILLNKERSEQGKQMFPQRKSCSCSHFNLFVDFKRGWKEIPLIWTALSNEEIIFTGRASAETDTVFKLELASYYHFTAEHWMWINNKTLNWIQTWNPSNLAPLRFGVVLHCKTPHRISGLVSDFVLRQQNSFHCQTNKSSRLTKCQIRCWELRLSPPETGRPENQEISAASR